MSYWRSWKSWISSSSSGSLTWSPGSKKLNRLVEIFQSVKFVKFGGNNKLAHLVEFIKLSNSGQVFFGRKVYNKQGSAMNIFLFNFLIRKFNYLLSKIYWVSLSFVSMIFNLITLKFSSDFQMCFEVSCVSLKLLWKLLTWVDQLSFSEDTFGFGRETTWKTDGCLGNHPPITPKWHHAILVLSQ